MGNRKRIHGVNLDSEEAHVERKYSRSFQTYCEICGLGFKRNDRLKTHILNNHTPHSCVTCGFECKGKNGLRKHILTKHTPHRCETCELEFSKNCRLQTHILNNHSPHLCDICGLETAGKNGLRKHILIKHKKQSSNLKKVNGRVAEEDEFSSKSIIENDIINEETAFNKTLLTKTWRIRGSRDPLSLMNSYRKNITHYLISLLIKSPRKFYIILDITMVKKNREGSHQKVTTYFRSSAKTILRSTQINEMLEDCSKQINTAFDSFTQKGSGWILESIDYLKVLSAVYEPIRGTFYVPTPKSIVNKKAVVNIHNENEKCFEYSVIASQHYSEIDAKNSSRPNQYNNWIGKYNFEGCSQPMKLEDISKFEKNNNMAINVYHIKSTGTLLTPLRITQKEVKLEEYVNLLLIEHHDRSHYTWIRNFDRLLRYDYHTKKFCPFCCQGFDKRYKKNLLEHLPLCRKYGGQRVMIPPQGKNIVQFNDLHKW